MKDMYEAKRNEAVKKPMIQEVDQSTSASETQS